MTQRTRNSLILTLFIAMSIILIATIDVFAESIPTSSGKINYNGKLPMRASASTGSRKITTLKKNYKITLLEEQFTSKTNSGNTYRWYKIKYKNKTGYVKSNRVSSVKYSTTYVYAKANTEYRAGPGTGMKKKGTIKKAQKVTVVMTAKAYKSKTTWYKIKIGSKYYYAKASGFSFTKPKETSNNTSASLPAKVANPVINGDFEKYMSDQGFPEDYKKYLRELHKKYPNWVFVAVNTGLSFKDVVDKESKDKVSLVNGVYPVSYRDKSKYSYQNGKYIAKDGSSWFNASRQVVEYYIDPRNFINEDRIYMFEDLSYHEYQSEIAVQKILNGSALAENAYEAKWFIEYGKKYDVSPISLAARARQEVGGGSPACSGYPIDGKLYYNPFNIGASTGSNPLKKGMERAKEEGWDTKKKAVEGGASLLGNSYVKRGQNTLYYQRFNVKNGINSVATYQYMTNIMAPYNEASSMKSTYAEYGILKEQLVFEIPIYSGMPAETKLP